MKLDRLLSIVIYLLNHDLVSARILADRFGVTVRTIQRDMDAINLAGIPLVAVQGPSGGYGIMENFKLDRRLLGTDDLFNIITALKGIATSLGDPRIDGTLQKIQGLVPAEKDDPFKGREEKLHIDFSALGGGLSWQDSFRVVQTAVETGRLLRFDYTNNRLEQIPRMVEPMTVVFQWRSWYLFAFCRLRQDYRLFRISRIRKAEVQAETFRRRDMSFGEFSRHNDPARSGTTVRISLRFAREMAPLAEEFHDGQDLARMPDGSFIVSTSMPEDGWLYGYILSYGHYVEVLEPERLRHIIRDGAKKITALYE
ncbi:MAG: YafY family protein [Spirochaetota bacterium]